MQSNVTARFAKLTSSKGTAQLVFEIMPESFGEVPYLAAHTGEEVELEVVMKVPAADVVVEAEELPFA